MDGTGLEGDLRTALALHLSTCPSLVLAALYEAVHDPSHDEGAQAGGPPRPSAPRALRLRTAVWADGLAAGRAPVEPEELPAPGESAASVALPWRCLAARELVLAGAQDATLSRDAATEAPPPVCAVPLCGRGGALGVVVFSGSPGAALPPEELAALRLGAERVARALEVTRLEEELARAREVARRASGFRDQVLAIVGHDLRNPLGAILMSAALLQKRGVGDGWQRRTVERIRSSTLRMGRIIDDLLSYTRTRLGSGIPIHRRPTDLGELTRRMVDELRAAHPDAAVELTLGGDLTGELDPDRLEQVVSNLVSNAIDHGEEGRPVEVTLRGLASVVAIEVTNAGEVPPTVLERAFEAFHRGPEPAARRASGLGLGLYIAREIVRHHGGDIAIESSRGRTVISLQVPRRPPEQAKEPKEREQVKNSKGVDP